MSLKKTYKEKIAPSVQKKLGYTNIMQVPKLEKVVINVGIGTYVRTGNKDYSDLKEHIRLIAGQQPVVRLSKKAISNFKLRAGMPVGLTVTLRGDRMYDFVDKLVTFVLPRIRDFRGISRKSFDDQGNYNLGIREHTIFAEVPTDDVVKNHGLQITIKTTAANKEAGLILLEEIGFPFSK